MTLLLLFTVSTSTKSLISARGDYIVITAVLTIGLHIFHNLTRPLRAPVRREKTIRSVIRVGFNSYIISSIVSLRKSSYWNFARIHHPYKTSHAT